MAGRKEAKPNAAAVAKAVKKGPRAALGRNMKKIRTSPHFFRPKTQVHQRSPKAPKHIVRQHTKFDDYRIIRSPHNSESALKKVEMNNTLVFLCDIQATKSQIRAAVTRRFQVKVVKVNTLIRPDCIKKAFVKLSKEHDALELANKIGLL